MLKEVKIMKKNNKKSNITNKTLQKYLTLKAKYDAVDYHVRPTKNVDSGAGGKSGEMGIKYCFGLRSCDHVTPNRTTHDFRIKIAGKVTKFEIKTGRSELIRKLRDGSTHNCFKSADYVIYAPYYYADVDPRDYFIVINITDFKKICDEVTGYEIKRGGNVTAMARFDNSKRKEGLVFDALDTYGTLLGDFLKEIGRA